MEKRRKGEKEKELLDQTAAEIDVFMITIRKYSLSSDIRKFPNLNLVIQPEGYW